VWSSDTVGSLSAPTAARPSTPEYSLQQHSGVTPIQNEFWVKQKHELIGKFLDLCVLKHDIILFPYLLQSFYLKCLFNGAVLV
jgi:hypothetical protein